MIVKAEKYKEATRAVELNDGYCPCLLERSDDTRCMCKEFSDAVMTLTDDEVIICRCGRFKAFK